MNHEQFAERIGAIKQNITAAIAQKEKQSQDLILQINKTLFDDRDYALVFLASLEAKLQENSQEKINQINNLEQEIASFKTELENEIVLFNNDHVLDHDKARLFSLKEEKLVEPRLKRKKELQELNQKITILDKECLQILKENEQALNEEEKNFRAKLQELERKMKLEVNRIAEAILTPIIKETPNPADEAAVVANKQIISEEREKGINEIAKIKLKYFSEMRQMEIAYVNYKHGLKRDKGVIREEYDQKIEDLGFGRKTIQNDLQKQTDMYDFDVYQNLNSLEKEYNLVQNKIKRKYYQDIDGKQIDIYAIRKSKNDVENLDFLGIFDYLNESDLNQIASFHKTVLDEQLIMSGTYGKLNESLLDIVEAFKNVNIEIINRFWDISSLYEKSLYSAFVILSYQAEIIKDFDRSFFEQELNQIINDYKNRQKQRYNEFTKQLNDNYKILNRQVTIIYNSLTDFTTNEIGSIKGHINTLNNLVKKLRDKANYYLKVEQDKKTRVLNNVKQVNVEQRRQEIEKLTQVDKKIEDEYFTKSNDLNKKIDEYQALKKSEDTKARQVHQAILTKSRANIMKFKNQYKKDLNDELSLIAHKYDTFIKETELERKTKLKMDQI